MINPTPYKTIEYVNDIEKTKKSIRKEWIWYRKVLRVVGNKPKLRQEVKAIVDELENKYYRVRQIPSPPTMG